MQPFPAFARGAALAAAIVATPVHAMLGEPLVGHPERVRVPPRSDRIDASILDLEVETLRGPRDMSIAQWAQPGGPTFCVIWRGRYKPDLRFLLGPELLALYADGRAEGGGWLRSATTLSGDLAVQSQGRVGGFYGSACLRSLTPPGFAATIQE